jgi:Holliday junction resolvase RusA-like endonuclease
MNLKKDSKIIMNKFKTTVPLPISVNRAYTFNKWTHQQIYTPEAKEYISKVATYLQSEMRKQKLKFPIDEYFYIDMKFWLSRKNADSHNYLKIANDMLETSGLTTNDKWIMNRIQKVEVDTKNPRIEISI